jgi:hypothetical protein
VLGVEALLGYFVIVGHLVLIRRARFNTCPPTNPKQRRAPEDESRGSSGTSRREIENRCRALEIRTRG